MKNLRLRTKVARSLGGSSRGVTLIEVLIALALFSIIAIVFLGGLTVAARAVFIGDQRTTAESLARAQMEFVKSSKYTAALPDAGGQAFYPKLEPKAAGGPVPHNYSIWSVNRTGDVLYGDDEIIAIAWNSTAGDYANTETGLQKITLVIKHDDRVVFTLEGFNRKSG